MLAAAASGVLALPAAAADHARGVPVKLRRRAGARDLAVAGSLTPKGRTLSAPKHGSDSRRGLDRDGTTGIGARDLGYISAIPRE